MAEGKQNEKVTDIRTYRKGPFFNIGIFVFGVVFVYLVVTVGLYLTNEHVQAYEVREGSILKDRAYTGLALRSETVVCADAAGYVNYFASEDSKVGAKTNVYALSSKKLDFQEPGAQEGGDLSADEEESLIVKIQSFSENFKEDDFHAVYSLKNNIQTVLEGKSAKSRENQLKAMLESSPEAAAVYTAASDGVISYTLDGFETVTEDDVTQQMVAKEQYDASELKNNTKVSVGDPVYKLITEDQWQLVIALDNVDAKDLADVEKVNVCFLKDNETEKADFEIRYTESGTLGFLTFYKSMVRYAGERYLDIELILEDESGLKIPKSSVTEKDFYLVPEAYLTQGGDKNETGVLVGTGEDAAAFQQVTVYYEDHESGTAYVDPAAFKEGATLTDPASGGQYALKKTGSLKGVYNINKGYAVFKQIEILCEGDEYYIVQEGNDYGLSNYDHIALDSSVVNEDDVVF